MVCGPSGTGKTFLLEALDQQAVEAGLKMAWFTLEDIGVLLRRHRADGFKTATAEELPDPVAVMDPLHVVRLAGDALDRCRRGFQPRTVSQPTSQPPSTTWACPVT